MDILGILGFGLTAIGTFYAWRAYKDSVDISEQKNNLLAVFTATQRLHKQIQSMIQKYIDEKDGADHFLYPNITFQQYLDVIKAEYEKSLSDKLYDDLKNSSSLNKSAIASILKEVENQSQAMTAFKNQLLFIL